MKITEIVDGKEIDVYVAAHTYLTSEGEKRITFYLDSTEKVHLYEQWYTLNDEQIKLFNTCKESLLGFLKHPESLKQFMNGGTFGLGFDMDKEYKIG
jgi:hypothetical protein